MEIEKNFLEDYISVVYENTNLKEGEACITHFLTSLYLNPHISTRDLSLALFIPVPVATAIKKEFQKCGLVLQERGVVLSDKGIEFVEEELGYKGVYRDKLYQILQNEDIRKRQIDELAIKYKGVFEDRPSVDVTVDQAKGTPETAFKRAMLCLETGSLIGKKLLCVGDDDLVSIALGLLLKELGVKSHKTEICVFDIDDRYINYIESIATLMDLPVKCYHTDLREPLPLHYTDYFDAFLLIPLTRSTGFLYFSAGVFLYLRKKGLPVFLSFGNKPLDDSMKMQSLFVEMGLVVSEISRDFNSYEGASLYAGTSQMILLRTMSGSRALIQGKYEKNCIPMISGMRSIPIYAELAEKL